MLCTGNSCRSQMAHGFLNALASEYANIYSAGIETHRLNLDAVSIMKEAGIDISFHASNHINEYQDIQWDFVLTVCDHAKENCPYLPAPNAKRYHHNFFDPSKVEGNSEEKHAAFLKTREQIKEYITTFINQNLT